MEKAEKYMEIVRALTESYDKFYDYINKSVILTPEEKNGVLEDYINKFVEMMRIKNI